MGAKGRLVLWSLLASVLFLPAATGTTAVGPVASPAAPSRNVAAAVSITATGDITLGQGGRYPSGGASALLAGVHPYLRGKLVLGNLETVLGDPTLAAELGAESKCAGRVEAACFSFIAPAAYAQGLRTSGYTLLNLANNHAYDYGILGESMTVGSLQRAHLAWVGRPGQITYSNQTRLRVAVIGAAPYAWAQNLLDINGTAQLVRQAARHAQIVVVTMHLGGEGTAYEHVRPAMESYLGEERGNPIAFAHAMINAGAGLVVGHGPHVLRGIEWYHNRLIAYSLGNLSGYHTLNTTGDLGLSAILHVTLNPDGTLQSASITPLQLTSSGTPAYDSHHQAWQQLNHLSHTDFANHAALITPNGTLTHPANDTQSRPHTPCLPSHQRLTVGRTPASGADGVSEGCK
jgi:hypothetical protein